MPRVFPEAPQIQSQPQDINLDRRVQAKGDRRGHGIFWKSVVNQKRQPPTLRPPPRCTTLDERLPVANRRRTNPHTSRRSWFDERGGWPWHLTLVIPGEGEGAIPHQLLRGGSRPELSGPAQQGWRPRSLACASRTEQQNGRAGLTRTCSWVCLYFSTLRGLRSPFSNPRHCGPVGHKPKLNGYGSLLLGGPQEAADPCCFSASSHPYVVTG